MMHVLLPYYQSQLPTVYMPIIISLPLPSNPTVERKILACRLSIGVTPNPCAPPPVSEAAALRSLLGNAIGYVKVVDCSALPIDVCPHCLIMAQSYPSEAQGTSTHVDFDAISETISGNSCGSAIRIGGFRAKNWNYRHLRYS